MMVTPGPAARVGAELHQTRVHSFALAALVWGFLCPIICRAEGVTVSGLSFPVDSIVHINENAVSVRLGAKESLIRRADLERFVVEETFADRALAGRLDARALLRFAEESFNGGESARAGLAFRALRWCSDANEEDILESLDVLSDGSAAKSELATAAKIALLPVFEVQRYPRLTARLVILAGRGDTAWVRQHAVPYTYGIKRPIEERLERELADQLRLRDLPAGADLVRFAREVYGVEDPISQRLSLWLERVRSLIRAVDDGDVETLGKALVVESSDPNLGGILSPVAMEGLHTAAAAAVDSGDPAKALDILARIDLLKRNQTTHELTRAALERVAAQPNSFLQRPEVLSYLDVIARNDPLAMELYRDKLVALIGRLLEEGKGSDSEPLLDRLKGISPPPTAVIDRLLVKQAEVYFSQGVHGLAARKLNESRSWGLEGVWLKCRLSIATMSAVTLGAFLAIVFSIVSLIVISLFRFRRSDNALHRSDSANEAIRSTKGDRVEDEEIAEEEDEPPRGFVVNELRRLSPGAQEYQRCLELLGLTANADVRSIKNAYRKLVKDVHPDRNKTNDEGSANRFIELTRVYDRILELRKEFGYHD